MKNKLPQVFLLFVSIGSYVLALNLNLFTAKGKLLGFEISKNSIDFFSSVEILKEENYLILAYSILTFVLVFPSIKYITLLCNIAGVKIINYSVNDFILGLQKFAMVDVMVISIILVSSKSNPGFEIQIQEGTYALLFSVITGILCTMMNYGSLGKTE